MRILLINSDEFVSVETRITRSPACIFNRFGIVFVILLIIVEIRVESSLLLIDVSLFEENL